MYDVIIIGGGPAGLTAGIYGVRAGLNTLVLSNSSVSGGQILNTYEVDNFPGLPGISGMDMGKAFRDHCDKLGVEFATGRVTSIEDAGDHKNVVTKKVTYETKAVIVATGASNKKLMVPGEDDYCGCGVSYCATCDGAFYKDMTVAVVGGGDVALEDALYLARACKQVYLIHRRDEFRGAKVLADAVLATSNITVCYDTVVESINGADGKVVSSTIKNVKSGEVSELNMDGIFIAVGTTPNTGVISGLPAMDEVGYIKADETGVTSIPGIFAAGDVRTKQLRQVSTAVGDGANCICSVEKFLRK